MTIIAMPNKATAERVAAGLEDGRGEVIEWPFSHDKHAGERRLAGLLVCLDSLEVLCQRCAGILENRKGDTRPASSGRSLSARIVLTAEAEGAPKSWTDDALREALLEAVDWYLDRVQDEALDRLGDPSPAPLFRLSASPASEQIEVKTLNKERTR